MKSSSVGTATISRTLDLLEALVRDDGVRPLSAIANELALPASTASRMAALLVRRGWIAPTRRGHYAAGLTLADLGSRAIPNRILADAARPLLRRLAHQSRAVAHLGVWDSDMVTYLVKEAQRDTSLFSREGGQLEAYCSAIGKILLAHLDPQERDAYLAAGPFVALTPHTVTDPQDIHAMLLKVAEHGFAFDSQEIAEGLFCIAVPVRNPIGEVVAAVSLSRTGAPHEEADTKRRLQSCADAISARLGEPATSLSVTPAVSLI